MGPFGQTSDEMMRENRTAWMKIPSTITIDGAQYLEQDEVVIKYEIQRAKDKGEKGIQSLSAMRL